jgi:hypothetical protein
MVNSPSITNLFHSMITVMLRLLSPPEKRLSNGMQPNLPLLPAISASPMLGIVSGFLPHLGTFLHCTRVKFPPSLPQISILQIVNQHYNHTYPGILPFCLKMMIPSRTLQHSHPSQKHNSGISTPPLPLVLQINAWPPFLHLLFNRQISMIGIYPWFHR